MEFTADTTLRGDAVPGKEEYLNSEKYEYKVWDWDREGNISGFIARLNEIRREHPSSSGVRELAFPSCR